jgi:hypothetical protein
LPPFGSSRLQARCAFLNCGVVASIPSDESFMPLPEGSGSGKFGTPFLRMQAENTTSACRFELPDNAVLVVIVSVESACATLTPDELPHPAAIRANAASAATATAGPALASCDRSVCVLLALRDLLTAPPSQPADQSL